MKNETRKQKREAEKIDRELNPEAYEHNFKTCFKCLEEKPLINFSPTLNKCLACTSHDILVKRHANMPKSVWLSAKHRATRIGIPFSITLEDVESVWTDVCPVLGIPLKANIGQPQNDSYSIDRIDNSKGYVTGNIAIVSNHFNSLKRNLTPTILRRMLAYMEGRLLP